MVAHRGGQPCTGTGSRRLDGNVSDDDLRAVFRPAHRRFGCRNRQAQAFPHGRFCGERCIRRSSGSRCQSRCIVRRRGCHCHDCFRRKGIQRSPHQRTVQFRRPSLGCLGRRCRSSRFGQSPALATPRSSSIYRGNGILPRDYIFHRETPDEIPHRRCPRFWYRRLLDGELHQRDRRLLPHPG